MSFTCPEVVGIPLISAGVTRYIYSTLSPSIPPSPHLDQIAQLDHSPQGSSILFFTLLQATSTCIVELIPTGLSSQLVPTFKLSLTDGM